MGKGNYNQGGEKIHKRSGAIYSKIRQGKYEGHTVINAWNYSKTRGLIKCTVSPYRNTREYRNADGDVKITMIAKVFYTRTGNEVIIPCSLNRNTGKVFLQDLGMVITPNGQGRTRSGKLAKGYFGMVQF